MGSDDLITNFGENESGSSLPPVDIANKLLEKVRDEQSKEAFKIIVEIYNNAKVPETEEELTALNLICEAYRIGSVLFK